tara:strand:- start:157 stop:447 length:291 start_codon:yes stop_codon:yes gene_type:complete
LTNKSDLIKQLKKSFPNFLVRDLEKTVSLILSEIKLALKRSEAVEIRSFGRFSTRIQKESIRRNPRTSEKVNVPKKHAIHWKQSKDLFNKINANEK